MHSLQEIASGERSRVNRKSGGYYNTMGWLSLLAQLVVGVQCSLSLSLCVSVVRLSQRRDYFLLSQEFGDLTQASNAMASADR